MGKHSYETRDLDREGLAILKAKLLNRTPKHAGEFAAKSYGEARSRFVDRLEGIQHMRDHADIITNAVDALTKLVDKFGTPEEQIRTATLQAAAQRVRELVREPHNTGHIENPNFFINHIPRHMTTGTATTFDTPIMFNEKEDE